VGAAGAPHSVFSYFEPGGAVVPASGAGGPPPVLDSLVSRPGGVVGSDADTDSDTDSGAGDSAGAGAAACAAAASAAAPPKPKPECEQKRDADSCLGELALSPGLMGMIRRRRR
jgi:hypothetical protein